MAGTLTGLARLLSYFYSPLHGSFLMYLQSWVIAFSKLDVKHVQPEPLQVITLQIFSYFMIVWKSPSSISRCLSTRIHSWLIITCSKLSLRVCIDGSRQLTEDLWAPITLAEPGINNLNKGSKQHELLRDTRARRRYLLTSKAVMCTQCQTSREVPGSQAQVGSWRPSSPTGSGGEDSVVL